jgi:hypothetical protein
MIMRVPRFAPLCALALLASLPAAAQVDFSRTVALGDSLSAGIVNYALVEKYQRNSVPALIARQAGVDFVQPLVGAPGIPPELELTALNVTPLGVSPVIGPKAGIGMPLNPTHQGPYNNLSMNGANTSDLLRRTGNIMELAQHIQAWAAGEVGLNQVNADLVLRDGQTTAIEQAIAAQGTFYLVWIGHNEVLGAVLSTVFVPGLTATAVADFQQDYQTLLGALRIHRPSADIMVGNLVDVTRAPYVTTIPPYITAPTGQRIPLIGEQGPLGENDFVTLGASALLAQGIGIPLAAGGTGQPLPEGGLVEGQFQAGVILRAAEAVAIREYIQTLNGIIETTAAAVGAGVFDAWSHYNRLVDRGEVIGGVRVTPAFLTGGIVGLDGFHMSNLGQAITANAWIEALNDQLGASLPLVNLRPFLFGGDTTTTVAAARAVFSTQAAIGLLRAYAPGARTDALQPRQPRLRQRLPQPERAPLPGADRETGGERPGS